MGRRAGSAPGIRRRPAERRHQGRLPADGGSAHRTDRCVGGVGPLDARQGAGTAEHVHSDLCPGRPARTAHRDDAGADLRPTRHVEPGAGARSAASGGQRRPHRVLRPRPARPYRRPAHPARARPGATRPGDDRDRDGQPARDRDGGHAPAAPTRGAARTRRLRDRLQHPGPAVEDTGRHREDRSLLCPGRRPTTPSSGASWPASSISPAISACGQWRRASNGPGSWASCAGWAATWSRATSSANPAAHRRSQPWCWPTSRCWLPICSDIWSSRPEVRPEPRRTDRGP
jgi:hypothetical protein